MHLVWHWALRLVGRGWRATGYLALVAGLAAGLTMATWGASRRTDTAFERRLRDADIPEQLVNLCPSSVTTVDEEVLHLCASYFAVAELPALRALPEVESAALIGFRGMTVAPADEPDDAVSTAELSSSDVSIHSIDGQQELLEGRWYREGATDELVLNEHLRDRTGLEVGDRVVLTVWGPDEVNTFAAEGETYAGATTTATVVGVSRGVLDLSSTRGLGQHDGPRAFRALDVESASGAAFAGVSLRARPGMSDELRDGIEGALEGRLYNLTPSVGPDEIQPIREAIDYEATATLALAALMAAASAVFVGQAVARHARREWADLDTLRALGVTLREARAAGTVRGLVTGLLGAATAVAVAVALSPLGPIGVGRRADPTTGLHVDALVVGVGAFGVLVVVALASRLGVARYWAGSAASARTSRAAAVARALPPPALAGLSMSRARLAGAALPVGTAVAGVAAAAATIVGAVVLVGSLDSLHRHPERYGAPWDLSIGATFDDGAQLEDALEFLRSRAEVSAGAQILGSDVEITAGEDAVVVWSQAFAPLDGVARTIDAPVLDGRPPVAPDEIALGAVTMRDLGVAPGDVVEVRPTTSETAVTEMTVVGSTVVNDSFESSPGRGAVVTPEWITTVAPEANPDPTVVDLAPGVDVTALRAQLAERYPGEVLGPVPQAAIRNLDRIRNLPYLLGMVVGALALASLTHALLLSVRRHRRTTAVLRSLGFTGRQVVAMVAAHATSFAVVAVAVGLPLGLMLGRWGWWSISEQIGVGGDPVTPLAMVALIGAAVLAVANLVALVPGWRSTHAATAEALRTE